MDIVADEPFRPEGTAQVALLLAFTGGYLDAYTWMIHGVMANAQTANLVLLWVHGTAGSWQQALHFVPPIAAFTVGVIVASWLRHVAGGRANVISILVEIALLVTVGILHNRLPDLAGTLGISFVAAMQAAVFTKVEGTVYSSVMITGNLRQVIEGLFAAASGGAQPGMLRRPAILASVCVAFGMGAAIGAFATKGMPNVALGLPVVALLVVLLCCESRREARSGSEA